MRASALYLLLSLAAAGAWPQDAAINGSVLAEWGFGKGDVWWDGTLQVSRGEVPNIEAYSFEADPKADQLFPQELRWTSLTKGYTDGLVFDITGSPDTLIVLDTKAGRFQVTLGELVRESPMTFPAADENRLVLTFRRPIAPDRVRIGDDRVEDDYPSVAVGPDGRATVAWLRFQDGADRIMAATFDGREVGEPVSVSSGPGDNFRPQVAAPDDGTVWVIWPSRVKGNWDIYARSLANGQVGPVLRLSDAKGPDLHCSAIPAGDALWVFWQGWRDGSFDILCRTLRNGKWSAETPVTDSPGSDWEPAAATGPDGQVTCVWDTYRHGSYDTYARTWRGGDWGREIPVAATPDFEAHASVAYDAEGKAWIAWENGGPDWGKDSTNAGFHSTRVLELRCLVNGVLHEPPDDLTANFPQNMAQQCEVGQLIRDPDGRLWLTFRHLVAGGVWAVHATVYGPDGWSAPALLPDSKGRQDQKVGLASGADGPPWAAWETDNRTRNVPLDSDVVVARLAVPQSEPASPKAGPEASVTPADLPKSGPRPRRALFADGERLLLFGDLHRHTDLSVCQTGKDGSMADLYRYAVDVARLDFVAVTDHIQHVKVPSPYERWRTEKMADMYLIPGRLTPLFAYERSQRFPYGHRNIISPTRGQLPIPRTEENKPTSANQGYEGENRIAPPTLWQRLLGSNPNQITIPHTSGNKVMGQDWQFSNPQLEPVVEIYQGCRISYEHPGAPDPTKPESDTSKVGSIWMALAKGIHVGFIAASDHVSTHISYAGVYAREHTREAIVDAMRERRTFASTDTLGVQFSVGGRPLGSEFAADSATPPPIEVNVLGTAPIKQIDLIKDNQVIYSTHPGQQRVRFEYCDADADSGTSYYYARVIQEDQMMAWGSPVWVTYR